MSNVCEGISSDYKNLFGFLGDKLSEPAHTITSLGCRQLGNSMLLIGLPGTVSNELNLLRNVKRFQKLIFFYWISSPAV